MKKSSKIICLFIILEAVLSIVALTGSEFSWKIVLLPVCIIPAMIFMTAIYATIK